MKNLSTHDKTYSDIPLSVIYNQIIRFMKENGIYTPYLEISLPQTNMSYERFLINFRRFKNTTLDHFFLYKFNVGEKYNAYAKYEDVEYEYAIDEFDCGRSFLIKTNDKWRSYFHAFISAYEKLKQIENKDGSQKK